MQFNGLARKLTVRQSNPQEQVESEGKNKGFGVRSEVLEFSSLCVIIHLRKVGFGGSGGPSPASS